MHNQNVLRLAEWNGAESWEVQAVASGKASDVQVSLAFRIGETFCGVRDVGREVRSPVRVELEQPNRRQQGGGKVSLGYQAGMPWIAYPTSTALKVAHQTGSSWSIETVDGAGMSYISLAFAPDAKPSVAYRSGTGTSTLKFAHKTGSTWAVQSVETGTYYGIFASLAYDPLTGYPTVAHSNGNLTNLRFVRWDGSQWVIEIAATGNCAHSSLAYDAGGSAAIAYNYAADTSGYKQLRIARRTGCSGTCWEDMLIEDAAPLLVPYDISLTFGPTGAAATSYGVAYPQTLKFAQETP